MERFNSNNNLVDDLWDCFIFLLRRRHRQTGPKEHEIERDQLWKNQEFHVNRILRDGFKTRGELYFLAERIRYESAPVDIQSEDVSDLITTFELVLNFEIKNTESVMRHLSTTFPTVIDMDSPFRSNSNPPPRTCEIFLREKIKQTYQYLKDKDMVYTGFVRQIANCLFYLSWRGDFSIPEKFLPEMNQLLRKWI
jgi:hypothetical protein